MNLFAIAISGRLPNFICRVIKFQKHLLTIINLCEFMRYLSKNVENKSRKDYFHKIFSGTVKEVIRLDSNEKKKI